MMTPLQTLQSRHSVRAFREEALSDTHVKKLKACITMINTHQQGLKFQLITNDPDPLAGFSKSYGVFTNPRNYMAAVVDTATPDVLERAGYYAEQVVIKSCELGVGSSFVGGTYNESKVKVQLRAGEKVLFLVLLGYPAEKTKFMAKIMAKMVHLKRMDAEQFFEPSGDLTEAIGKFPFLTVGLEAVACAPSALNKRPTRIFLRHDSAGDALCARVDDSNPKNLIDLGIAKYNFNYATSTECEWGNGAPLTGGYTLL